MSFGQGARGQGRQGVMSSQCFAAKMLVVNLHNIAPNISKPTNVALLAQLAPNVLVYI